MKVMAIASPTAKFTPELLQEHMPEEVPATLQLYLDGKVEQFWFREKKGPIFLMEAESVEHAHATLSTLSLVAAGLMSYEVMPVGPLIPLARLIPAR